MLMKYDNISDEEIQEKGNKERERKERKERKRRRNKKEGKRGRMLEKERRNKEWKGEMKVCR